MADLSFRVAVRRREAITFTLDGDEHVYNFDPPKVASMVVPLLADGATDMDAAKQAFGWLDRGMSDEDQKHLSARLMDPEDDMDFGVVEDIVEGLIEKVGGRPTT